MKAGVSWVRMSEVPADQSPKNFFFYGGPLPLSAIRKPAIYQNQFAIDLPLIRIAFIAICH